MLSLSDNGVGNNGQLQTSKTRRGHCVTHCYFWVGKGALTVGGRGVSGGCVGGRVGGGRGFFRDGHPCVIVKLVCTNCLFCLW
jgi:hypothetical protein